MLSASAQLAGSTDTAASFDIDNEVGRADNATVYDVLEKGLDDLSDLCDVVMDKVSAAREEFNANRMST